MRPLPLLLLLPLVSCVKLGGLPGLDPYTPKVRFERVALQKVTFEKADADFVFAVSNPNPVAVKIASYTYDLDVAGHDFLAGDEQGGLELVSRGTSELVLPVGLVFADLIDLAGATKGQDTVPFRINGTFGFSTPIGEVRIPYEESGEIPVLRPPKVRLAGLRVATFEPLKNKARLELDVGLTHQQAASLGFRDFDYGVRLGGTQVATGLVPDAATVQPGTEQVVVLPLDVDLLQLGSTVVTAIAKKQPVDVGLRADLQVTTPLGAIPLKVDESKRLEIR